MGDMKESEHISEIKAGLWEIVECLLAQKEAGHLPEAKCKALTVKLAQAQAYMIYRGEIVAEQSVDVSKDAKAKLAKRRREWVRMCKTDSLN